MSSVVFQTSVYALAFKFKQAGLCLDWCSVFSIQIICLFFFLLHTSTRTVHFRAADRAAGHGLEMNEKSG